eukprot:1917553-Lingulodinium_polyedra.AAC.1
MTSASRATAASFLREGAGPQVPPRSVATVAAAFAAAVGQRGAPLMPHRTVMAPHHEAGAQP